MKGLVRFSQWAHKIPNFELSLLALTLNGNKRNPFVNGRESTVNRALDGSIYPG